MRIKTQEMTDVYQEIFTITPHQVQIIINHLICTRRVVAYKKQLIIIIHIWKKWYNYNVQYL